MNELIRKRVTDIVEDGTDPDSTVGTNNWLVFLALVYLANIIADGFKQLHDDQQEISQSINECDMTLDAIMYGLPEND